MNWIPDFLLALVALATFSLFTGCVFETHMDRGSDSLLSTIDGIPAIDHATGEGILILVNDPQTDVAFLDLDCDLDIRAAERIVAHRRGLDGLEGSWDDDLFDDLFELDDVAYVGPAAMQSLGEVAHALDLVPAIEIEGVLFTAAEREDTLLLVNHASIDALDIDAGLDSRAADSLIYGRPYLGLVEVGDRPWVGPSALESLRGFAPLWLDETVLP